MTFYNCRYAGANETAANVWWHDTQTAACHVWNFAIDTGSVQTQFTDAGTANSWINVRFDWHDTYQWMDTAPVEPKWKEKREKKLKERYGVEELPDMDEPEAVAAIEETSGKFLESVLTPAELDMFRKEQLVRVESGLEEAVHYVVRRGRHVKIERYKDGKLVEKLCYIVLWNEVPALDILATKVFDLKHNEAMVLEVANRH